MAIGIPGVKFLPKNNEDDDSENAQRLQTMAANKPRTVTVTVFRVQHKYDPVNLKWYKMVTHFHLSWKTSYENLISSLSRQARKSAFSDLVLVCEDNEIVSAHQVILSSSSSFLRSLLLQHKENLTGERPTILIPDITKQDLEDLLQFMYHGTVTLEENRYQHLVSLSKLFGFEEKLQVEKQKENLSDEGSLERLFKTKKSFVKLEKINVKSTSREGSSSRTVESDANDSFDHVDSFDHLEIADDMDHHKDDEVDEDHDEKSAEKSLLKIKAKPKLSPETKRRYNRNKLGTFLCPYCARIFTLKKTLKFHIQNIHEGIRYQCDKCPYLATSKSSLSIHQRCRHGGQLLYCDQCEYSTSLKTSLNLHMRIKHTDTSKVWKCEDCDYKSSQRSNLKKHRDAKHDNVRYTCDVCMKSLSQKGQLKVHMIKFHGIDRRTYQTAALLNKTSTDT